MEVKIGVQHANRELVLESEQSPDEVQALVAEALSGNTGLLQLTDDKGRLDLKLEAFGYRWFRLRAPAERATP